MAMDKLNEFFQLLSTIKINYQATFALIISLLSIVAAIASLIVALASLSISKKIYVLTSLDYIPLIEFEIAGDPPYCYWPEIRNRQLIITNRNSDVYKIDTVTVLGVEGIGFEDYMNNKIVEIPLVHIHENVEYWYSKESNEKIVLNFKDLPVDSDRETTYSKIKEKIDADYNLDLTTKPNPKGYALPSLQTCDYYINIEYEDKFENVKNVYYKYYHIHGMGYRKMRISEDEYKNFLEKFNKIPWESDFNILWEYLIKEYSHSLA